MPTYSYACTECDNRFDAVQAFTDDALTSCPKCSGRLPSSSARSAWSSRAAVSTRNDSRDAAKSSINASGGESSSSSEKSDKSEKSSDKPAEKSADKPKSTEKVEVKFGQVEFQFLVELVGARLQVAVIHRSPRDPCRSALSMPSVEPGGIAQSVST